MKKDPSRRGGGREGSFIYVGRLTKKVNTSKAKVYFPISEKMTNMKR